MKAYRVVVSVEAFDDSDSEQEVEVMDLPYKAFETYDQEKAVEILYQVIGTYRDTFVHISA